MNVSPATLPDNESGSPEAMSYMLPAELQIVTIESIAEEWAQFSIAPKTTLTLDAAQCEYITTPGMQLIIALEKQLSSVGVALLLTHVNDPIKAAFKIAGLENLLTHLTSPPDSRFNQTQQ